MQLEFFPKAIDKNDVQNNKLKPEDRAFHNWYRFVLSFPAHLVREYISKFDLKKDAVILDPFCGTGTTLVEAKKQSIKSIGIEAHPMAHFAAKVKTNWDLDTEQIMKSAEQVYQKCESEAGKYGDNLKTLSSEQELLLLKNSINPIPLHKCLVLLEEVNKVNNPDIRNLELLALAFVAVYSASNL
nr:DNA methyltransferase [Fodinibius sp.]